MRSKISAALALSAAAVVASLALAGCSSSSSSASTPSASATGNAASAKCTPPKSGSESSAVKVTGAKGAEPTVTFDKPLKATAIQRSYISKGDGEKAANGRTVDVALLAYNGTSGKKLTSNGFTDKQTIPVTVGDDTMIPGLTAAVECAPVGSRLVTTATAKEAWGQADPTALSGLKATDTIIFVADIVDALPTKADGASQPAQDGFPTVKLASDGKPTVTIPKTTAPTATKIEVLKKGTGEVVRDTDSVTLQYQGSLWRNGKVFDQSWGKQPITNAANGFVPGFNKAITGQTVGSQILVIIPPADGYGTAGQSQAGIKGTDTLVFVIDILKTTHS